MVQRHKRINNSRTIESYVCPSTSTVNHVTSCRIIIDWAWFNVSAPTQYRLYGPLTGPVGPFCMIELLYLTWCM